ncbi:F-box/LRR-repeat protein 17-like [Meriones unguiculatus]|uniref:F-box/LRR-repeat protein 17-like n=1 Tax=Meriones unguiculatus TaxID=10047 RepID=UPI001088B7D9|nr:F-box/LRR-repeat protein 17-like [Meriones unguiculatus]
MGHFLSKEARNRPSQKKPRCCSWCRRRRPLIRLPGRATTKASPQAAGSRNRDCFFRGPCMLCFIVHSPGGPAPAGPEEEPPLSPPPPLPPRDRAYAAAPLQPLEPRYAALAAEDCAAAARRFLLSSAAAAAASSASSPATRCRELGLAAAAAWEQQGRSLFVASMGPLRFLGPPAAVQLFQGLPPHGEHPLAPEIVCKVQEAGIPDSTFCMQPRGGGGGGEGGVGGRGGRGPVGGGASLLQQLDAGCCHAPEQSPPGLGSRPTSPASQSSLLEAAEDVLRAGGIAPWSAQPQLESRDADYKKLPENPCSYFRESPPETLDINQLPGSIVLEVDVDD